MSYLAYILSACIIVSVPFVKISNGFTIRDKEQDIRKLEPSAINSMIRYHGTKKTVEELYSDWNIWNQLLKKIGSGNREWLYIAVRLKPASDAGASEMLNFAVGEALENEPELVLEIAVGEYSIEEICGGPDIDDLKYSTYDKATNAIKRRIDALEKIDTKKIENTRIYCIKKLKESITHLKFFMGN